jgi:hypothetical protein
MAETGEYNTGLLKRIAALWLRHRGNPVVMANVPQQLRDVLDEAVRKTGMEQAP